MIEIVGAFFSILAALLPLVLAHAAERKQTKTQENIDVLLLAPDPVDASLELSRLYQEAYDRHPAGQPPPETGV